MNNLALKWVDRSRDLWEVGACVWMVQLICHHTRGPVPTESRQLLYARSRDGDAKGDAKHNNNKPLDHWPTGLVSESTCNYESPRCVGVQSTNPLISHSWQPLQSSYYYRHNTMAQY